jgi:hypothetical protein
VCGKDFSCSGYGLTEKVGQNLTRGKGSNKIEECMTLRNYFEYLTSLLAFQEFLFFTELCLQEHC